MQKENTGKESDGLDAFDLFTLKNLGVVIDNEGVLITRIKVDKERGRRLENEIYFEQFNQ